MGEKIKVRLGKVQETLVLPLWGRAVEAKSPHPKLIDNRAVEILERIDYDFSTITRNISWLSQLAWVARSLHMDRAIQAFLAAHPRATIIDIGCGLDTTFDRIDNGTVTFYELDLSDVIGLRNALFPDHERRHTITSSFLEQEWFDRIHVEDGLLCVAAGVLYYFDEEQIRRFFVTVADRFAPCEMLFDGMSSFMLRIANKRVIKDGGMDETAVLKWAVRSAKTLEKWDPRISVVQQVPIYQGFGKGYSTDRKCALWFFDLLKAASIIHVRITP